MVHNSAKTEDSNANASGEVCVGNHRDLSLAGQPAQVHALEDRAALVGEVIALNGARIAELEDQVLALELLAKEHKKSRHQFIDTFKRDNFDASDDDSDDRVAQEGYMPADGANAIADAAIYTLDRRSDVHIFKELYGLEHLQVLRMNYEPAITAMNIHASIISSQDKVGSEKFYESFAEFIRILKASGYRESYLDDGEPGSLTHAYQSFLQCSKDEVSDRVD